MRKTTLFLQVTARRLSNPVFFMLLALSFGLWYITKLGHVYSTQINIPVRIDSTNYSVRCSVEGLGYQILVHKIAPRKSTIILSGDNIAVTPSATAPGVYEISSFALQNIISTKVTDLKIKSVDSPIEVETPLRQP